MNEGTPYVWAQHYIDTHIHNHTLRAGTEEEFFELLDKDFIDPNENRTALDKLERYRMKEGMPATDYFQQLEIYARKAGYIGNDIYLIRHIEKSVPSILIENLHNGATHIPTRYRHYRDKIIQIDNIQHRLHAIKDTPRQTPTSSSTPVSSLTKKKQETHRKKEAPSSPSKKPFFYHRPRKVAAQQQAQKETKVEVTGNCFLCGKTGHWKNDCPQMKKIHDIRSRIGLLSEPEVSALKESFLEDL
jgi:hypothetical protein